MIHKLTEETDFEKHHRVYKKHLDKAVQEIMHLTHSDSKSKQFIENILGKFEEVGYNGGYYDGYWSAYKLAEQGELLSDKHGNQRR